MRTATRSPRTGNRSPPASQVQLNAGTREQSRDGRRRASRPPLQSRAEMVWGCLLWAEDTLGDVLLPDLGVAHVPLGDIDALVPCLGHDGRERRVEEAGGGGETAAEAVAAVGAWVEADALDGGLDDADHVEVTEPVLAGLAVLADIE